MFSMAASTPPSRPQRRPKYEVYGQPLPLRTHPLPAFIPQNPLSILRIAWVLISEIVFPPCAHSTSQASSPKLRGLFKRSSECYTAYLDLYTNAVHVTDPSAVHALWEQGFFGKGNLSRSEPEWLQRMEALRLSKMSAREKTALEVTNQRRAQRREMKMQRAREEIEALEALVRDEQDAEKKLESARGGEDGEAEDKAEALAVEEQEAEIAMNGLADAKSNGHVLKSFEAETPAIATLKGTDSRPGIEEFTHLQPPTTHPPSGSERFTNQEHLQLTSSETLFLVYGLGILEVLDPHTHKPLSTPSLIAHFSRTSTFPASPTPSYPKPITDIDPDNPFLLSYVVYHHFRSLGWVVRPGVKFSVDYLLYARGPVFSHAQFAIAILPAYTHPYWTTGEGARSRDEVQRRRKHVAQMEKRDWWWFHNLSRVQSQVLKSLVLCWVEVPPPVGHEDTSSGDDASLLMGWRNADVGALLKRYRVKEVVCRRWTPQRNLK